MAHTVSLVNMKGGVGKSTIAVNLAWEYATDPWHRRVLLADLDPQFNASQYLIGQEQYAKAVLEEAKPTMWDLFEQNTRTPGQPLREFDPRAAIHPVRRFQSGGRIDLIPSRLELALSLWNPAQKESLLQKSLAQVATEYDIVIIDCPPTESVLTYAAYLASDHVLVPVKPEYLSAIGLPLLRQSLGGFHRENAGHELDVTGIVFNAVSDYSPEELRAKSEVRELAKDFSWKVFRAEVPYSRSFPKGAREGRADLLDLLCADQTGREVSRLCSGACEGDRHMSDEQLSEREMALILDLSRLLKKYGPEVFDSLAEALSDPEWPDRLSRILRAVSSTAPQRQQVRESRRSRSTADRVETQLRNADADHVALLRPIAESLITAEILPHLRDVTELALTIGLPAPRARSRGEAIVDLVRVLLAMPMDELEKVVPAIMASADRGQRSLEGWSRIIERSRAATTGRETS